MDDFSIFFLNVLIFFQFLDLTSALVLMILFEYSMPVRFKIMSDIFTGKTTIKISLLLNTYFSVEEIH